MSMKQRMKAMRDAIKTIEKQFGRGSIMALGDQHVEAIPTIGSGSPTLDEALGCGGYPEGRLVEIYGPESCGKTTLALHAIAECQRDGGIAGIIDAEHALDVTYARALGVKADELLISQPDCGEQALDIAETLVRSGALSLLVIDSVAALVPRAEVAGEMGDNHVGLQARLMSRALRKLTGIAHRTGTTIIFINQLRMKIGVMFGSPEVTTGGNALKYYASLRLDVRRIGAVKAGDEFRGNRTRVKVVKNKLAPPFRTAEFDIRYGEGIDRWGDSLDRAVANELITKRGAYYQIDGESVAQGREKMRHYLKENPEVLERLLRPAAPDAQCGSRPQAEAESRAASDSEAKSEAKSEAAA